MNEGMKCAVMKGIGEMEFTSRSVPKPSQGEVLVKVEYVGICGSDIHYFESGRIGDFIVKPPFVLGHESSGTVIEVGAGVTDLRVGDRVTLEPGKTCGKCRYCKSGKYNLCPEVEFFATPPYDGVFQEYVTHPSSLCFKLPENVDSMEGALIEPLAVGFHAAMQGDAKPGKKAIVFGAGFIGLMSMMALKVCGVDAVYMVDIMQNRLDKAIELGADGVINSANVKLQDEVRKITNKQGFDLAVETAGTEITTNEAIDSTCRGATVVLVGYDQTGMRNMKIGLALDKELTFKTVFRYRHIYPMAIEAVAQGKINLKDAVTNIFEFDDLQNAMDRSMKEKSRIVKSVVKM